MCIPRPQCFDATDMLAYEHPLEDPSYPEVWFYTDRLSYRPGETVHFHISSSAPSFRLRIIRDGFAPIIVEDLGPLEAPLTRLPPDFIESGCAWPETHSWRIPPDTRLGFYIASTYAEDRWTPSPPRTTATSR